MKQISDLQEDRNKFKPKMPAVFQGDLKKIGVTEGEKTGAVADDEILKNQFGDTFGQPTLTFAAVDQTEAPEACKVGVVLSGGPAPGGHNVILGLFDGLKRLNENSRLFGFRKGPGGIVENDVLEITSDLADEYRNTGGFDLIQSGRTKIETPEQFEACLKTCQSLELKALLVIGGDDSNTNAALLAEYFKSHGSDIQVIGAPKTIDGDLKNDSIEVSFGFDTACKTYAEMVGNICRDAVSSAKYWHFIKLMGRSASHITLEVALQTRVNLALIGEEVKENKWTLGQIVDQLASAVVERSRLGRNYGVVLVPEGLIEFIPEMGDLISDLNEMLATENDAFSALSNVDEQISFVIEKLSAKNSALYSSLPLKIQSQLIAERDPHGNVQVSLIETEQLLGQMVAEKIKQNDAYQAKFSWLHHFFGYEGRCAMPSNFDTEYAYNLGLVACLLTRLGKTGYLSSLQQLDKTTNDWTPAGIPLTSIMNMERRHGKDKPVIRKALVDLKDKPFEVFAKHREAWALEDAYCYTGPIQYYGPEAICDRKPVTLILENGGEY